MTSLSRKRRLIIAIAPSWLVRTPASLVISVLCCVPGVLLAQQPNSARILPIAQQSDYGSERSAYALDLSQMKTASLESESVFFERVARQSKLEESRLAVRRARDDLLAARRNLNLPAMERFEEEISSRMIRIQEAVDLAERNLQQARAELTAFYDEASPRLAAIAAGEYSAAPLYFEIVQRIKAAEHSLEIAGMQLSELSRPRGAMDEVRDALDQTLKGLGAEDPRRPNLNQAAHQVDRAAQELRTAQREVQWMRQNLKQIRQEHLPDCISPGNAEGDGTRTLLKRSVVSLGLLETAEHRVAELRATLQRQRNASTAAIQRSEQADSILYPVHAQVREFQAKADKLLDWAGAQLLEIKQLLVSDGSEVSTRCSHCGKMIRRTRKVLDPSTTCALVEEPLRNTEETIQQALSVATNMGNLLAEARQPAESETAIRRARALSKLRGQARVIAGAQPVTPGAQGQLQEALQRVQEFQNQEFEFYPGETYPVVVQEAPPRSFPPMSATYAARQTWYNAGYFDDLALERYGHSFGLVQPVVSYGKFLIDLVLVPYRVVAEPPYQRQYTLGYHRPGDYVPHKIYLPSPHACALVVQGTVWTLLLTLMP